MPTPLFARELERLERRIADGQVSTHDALEAAFALGSECERLEIMHAACEGYSRARATREQRWKLGDSDPPPRK